MNEVLYIIALSLGSVVTIFILTKLMGYREISQMSTFDYINSITIGSIAAEMATSLENNFTQPLVAMIVYALAALTLSWISLKSLRARRVIEGTPLVLLNGGGTLSGEPEKSENQCDGISRPMPCQRIF